MKIYYSEFHSFTDSLQTVKEWKNTKNLLNEFTAKISPFKLLLIYYEDTEAGSSTRHCFHNSVP